MDKRRSRSFDDIWNVVLAFLTRTYWLWFILGCLLVAVVSFWKLGELDILAWDEARHGVNAYEMTQSHSYIQTSYLYQPDYYNLKPPLSVWCIALCYRLFGYTAFGLRFYSALAYLIMAVIVSLSVKKHHGVFASLLLLLAFSACHMFLGLHMARTGDADSLFTLFYAVSMLCGIRWMENMEKPRYLYIACLSFSFAFLSRSWHAGCIPLTLLASLIASGKLKKLRLRSCLIGLACALGPVLVWAAARYAQDGMEFFTQMIQIDLLARTGTAIENHGGGWDYYARYILGDAFSCYLLLTCGVGVFAYCAQRKIPSVRNRCYLMWFAVPIALFSCFRTKMDWYIHPAMLPLLIIAAVTLGKMLTVKPRSPFLNPVAIGLIITMGLFAVQSLVMVHDFYLWNDTQGVMAVLKTLTRDADYAGQKCYLAYTDWSQNTVLQAELSADLKPDYGGMNGFESDAPDGSLLILKQSELEEKAAPRCGYRIAAEYGEYVMLMKDGETPGDAALPEKPAT